MADRISIRDLARMAGVSRTTVSLALRGSHEVSEETRQRIQALAREHDYRSHPAVNALMQQVGRGKKVQDEEVIAFIRSGSEPEERAPGPLEMLEGARQEAHRLGYRLEVFWAGYCAENSEKLARILYHRGIRGVIWGPMPYPHPPIKFPWELFVPIACTASTEVPGLPVVGIHHPKGMALVLEELTSRGAQRIGFIEQQMEDRRQDFGWLLGVDLYKHRGGKVPVFVHVLRSWEPDEGNILSWIKRHQLDVVILSNSTYLLSPFLEGKIARVSLDVPRAELGKVAGLHQDMLRIGQHAVRSMSIRLANGILGLPEYSFSVVTGAQFVDGDSLRPLQKVR